MTPVVLELNLCDTSEQWHALRQDVELPDPILPGIFIRGGSKVDIPSVAPADAPMDSGIRGIVLDLELGLAVCLLPPCNAPTHTVWEWLAEHPAWRYHGPLATPLDLRAEDQGDDR